ncbi:sphingosine kinase 1 isoform X1 [Erinaceus europaeus]|uniref:Sphingosine kinase 1 isoform X1 n=2 Tax=Erinaceus europaeus TaxID=9365 RepID=A0ABM3YCK5_ERIEU|nr:sphingosine kinase 1 isoform X1 [Erinaceus europaeus]
MPKCLAPCTDSDGPDGRPPGSRPVPVGRSAAFSLSDPAAPGNDAGAPAAPVSGGEGEPHSSDHGGRLGSTDKRLKEGAAGGAPTALGTSCEPDSRVEVMDSVAGWGLAAFGGFVSAVAGPGGQLPRPCTVLVLLNPRGGKGKGLQLFWKQVQPQLVQADISFKLLLTERKNHAREMVRAEELGCWDALVVMSGDGLMYEVINGLMDRPDWETAIKKPLCSLPAGSGNALAASLNHYAGYEQVTNDDLLTNCTLLLCRRVLAPMNLLSLQMASGLRLFSVLSLAWGFIADVDIESEKYRRLGEMRFTLGTFLRLAALRIYRGRLAYLPVGVASKKPTGSPLEQQHQGLVDAHLVPLEEPVPSHWTVVPEQDFVLVLALLHSHLGSEMFAAPMGSMAGAMHLFYVRAGISRAMLLRLFLAMEKGRHMELDCPYLVYVPVVAFRLEPQDGKGVFAVDGEMAVSEAVQGQVHPDYLWVVSGGTESLPSLESQPLPRL